MRIKPSELPPIEKTVFARRITRYGVTASKECWEAKTTDGRWVFVREDDVGTPWLVRRRAGGEVEAMCGSLLKARIAAARFDGIIR